MTSAKFDVQRWLKWNNHIQKPVLKTETKYEKNGFSERDSDVESLIGHIESRRVDLTSNYHDWVNIGFAIADEYGMFGCGYFHRVSRFHPKYHPQECEAQYRKCLRGRSGITIRTFFWMAAQAGITPGV